MTSKLIKNISETHFFSNIGGVELFRRYYFGSEKMLSGRQGI